jgi:hypothetical protein
MHTHTHIHTYVCMYVCMYVRTYVYTRVYTKVSGLAAWSENCKWYSSLSLGTVISYFMSQSSEFCRHNHLCCFFTSNTKGKHIFRYRLSLETFGYPFVRTYVHAYVHIYIVEETKRRNLMKLFIT